MYKKAEFEITEFEVEDLIVTSGTSGDQRGGETNIKPDFGVEEEE